MFLSDGGGEKTVSNWISPNGVPLKPYPVKENPHNISPIITGYVYIFDSFETFQLFF